eukprot:scaffold2992_cov214-Amphora_coffeaeformis.AAC.16
MALASLALGRNGRQHITNWSSDTGLWFRIKNISHRRLLVGLCVAVILAQILSFRRLFLFPVPPGFLPFHDGTTKPIVSFIIPSTLKRGTLKRTIQSLQRQTIPHWEAIVGVDMKTSPFSSTEAFNTEAQKYNNDPRVRIIPIVTESDDRGDSPARNGAGGVRNVMMQEHARADWVAFVDDDDTLTPYYIDYLQQGLQQLSSSSSQQRQHQSSSADILIFRMKLNSLQEEWYKGILPPLPHGPVSSLLTVGISFAVRRSVVSNRTNGAATPENNNELPMMQFEPGKAEDFYFLLKAQQLGARIGQTCCVGYYVRSGPPSDERRNAFCRWEKGYVVEKGFRPHQILGPHLFNETTVVPCPA